MSATDKYIGKIFKGGNRNVHRRILSMVNCNNRWYINYTSCGHTAKNGWRVHGDEKICLRSTFNAWLKEEVES